MNYFAYAVQFLAIAGMLAVPEAGYVRKHGGLSTEGRLRPSGSSSRALRGAPVLLQTDVLVNSESHEPKQKPTEIEQPKEQQDRSRGVDDLQASSDDTHMILIEVGHTHARGSKIRFLRISAPLFGVALLVQSLIVLGLIIFFWTRCVRPKQASSQLLAYVNLLTPCSKEELQRQLPEKPMDCAFSRPWSSKTAVRLEARVEGITTGFAPGVLQAPLSQRDCVVYSSAVSQQTHDGMNPVSVAFEQNQINFELSLLDDPQTRIEVRGEDVRLFDIEEGHCAKTETFDAAPNHWQVFAMRRRSDSAGLVGMMPPAPRFGEEPLHFQEYALLVGAQVTVVGELHRLPDGRLELQPPALSAPVAAAKRNEPWRTSWERAGCNDEGEHFGHKVLVSDCASLLTSYQDSSTDQHGSTLDQLFL